MLLDEWTRVSAEEGDDFMGLKRIWLLHRSSITRMRDVILHMLRVPHSVRVCVCAVNTVCVCETVQPRLKSDFRLLNS